MGARFTTGIDVHPGRAQRSCRVAALSLARRDRGGDVDVPALVPRPQHARPSVARRHRLRVRALASALSIPAARALITSAGRALGIPARTRGRPPICRGAPWPRRARDGYRLRSARDERRDRRGGRRRAIRCVGDARAACTARSRAASRCRACDRRRAGDCAGASFPTTSRADRCRPCATSRSGFADSPRFKINGYSIVHGARLRRRRASVRRAADADHARGAARSSRSTRALPRRADPRAADVRAHARDAAVGANSRRSPSCRTGSCFRLRTRRRMRISRRSCARSAAAGKVPFFHLGSDEPIDLGRGARSRSQAKVCARLRRRTSCASSRSSGRVGRATDDLGRCDPAEIRRSFGCFRRTS